MYLARRVREYRVRRDDFGGVDNPGFGFYNGNINFLSKKIIFFRATKWSFVSTDCLMAGDGFMSDKIDAILLASGCSNRFGRENKLLWPFRGTALAERALRLVCGMAGLNQMHFVYFDAGLGDLAKKYPVSLVRNLNPERGVCESVRLGVAASSADFYLFMHCDQPLLDADTVEAVLAFRRPGFIAAPSWRGTPGNPALFSSYFRQELLELPDGESPRSIKRRYPERVLEAKVAGLLPLRDIDTREDLEFFEALSLERESPVESLVRV